MYDNVGDNVIFWGSLVCVFANMSTNKHKRLHDNIKASLTFICGFSDTILATGKFGLRINVTAEYGSTRTITTQQKQKIIKKRKNTKLSF